MAVKTIKTTKTIKGNGKGNGKKKENGRAHFVDVYQQWLRSNSACPAGLCDVEDLTLEETWLQWPKYRDWLCSRLMTFPDYSATKGGKVPFAILLAGHKRGLVPDSHLPKPTLITVTFSQYGEVTRDLKMKVTRLFSESTLDVNNVEVKAKARAARAAKKG